MPTVRDPALAAAGGHVISAIVQYAPYALRAGWKRNANTWPTESSTCSSSMRRPARPGPRVRSADSGDIERRFRITGGIGITPKLAFDQFSMLRPVPGRPVPHAVARPLPVRRRLASGRRRDRPGRPQRGANILAMDSTTYEDPRPELDDPQPQPLKLRFHPRARAGARSTASTQGGLHFGRRLYDGGAGNTSPSATPRRSTTSRRRRSTRSPGRRPHASWTGW